MYRYMFLVSDLSSSRKYTVRVVTGWRESRGRGSPRKMMGVALRSWPLTKDHGGTVVGNNTFNDCVDREYAK
jgi:hypothetical protein